MTDLERPRRQRAPVLDRHRERTPVGDGDEHGDELDADRLRTRFVSRCFAAPHSSRPRRFSDLALDLAANLRPGKQGGAGRREGSDFDLAPNRDPTGATDIVVKAIGERRIGKLPVWKQTVANAIIRRARTDVTGCLVYTF